MGILVQLGEVALRTQRIARWERVCWEGVQADFNVTQRGLEDMNMIWVPWPPAMPGQGYRTQREGVYPAMNDGSAPTPPFLQPYDVHTEVYTASFNANDPVTVDGGCKYPNAAEQMNSSPPNAGQDANPHFAPEAMDFKQTQHLAPPIFAWQHPTDVVGSGWNNYDNTSHVTSAATTRRNTAIGWMLPQTVPHNSHRGSIGASSLGISGADLSQRIEQAVGSGRFRKSEPGLIGQWSVEEQDRGYV